MPPRLSERRDCGFEPLASTDRYGTTLESRGAPLGLCADRDSVDRLAGGRGRQARFGAGRARRRAHGRSAGRVHPDARDGHAPVAGSRRPGSVRERGLDARLTAVPRLHHAGGVRAAIRRDTGRGAGGRGLAPGPRPPSGPGQPQLALDSGDRHRRRAVAGVLDFVLAGRASHRHDRDRQPAGAVARFHDRAGRASRDRAEHAVAGKAAARAVACRGRPAFARCSRPGPCRHRRTSAMLRSHVGDQPGRVHGRPDRCGLWVLRPLSGRRRGCGADRRDPRARVLRPQRHRGVRAVLRHQRAVRHDRRSTASTRTAGPAPARPRSTSKT